MFTCLLFVGDTNLIGDSMTAFVVMRITVTNPSKLKGYQQVAPSIIKSFGGKMLARGGDVLTLEGEVETRRIVIVEFPTQDRAREFYNSKEYAEAVNLREGAAEFEIISVDGLC